MGLPGRDVTALGTSGAAGTWWHSHSRLDPSLRGRGGDQGLCLQQGLCGS